MENFAMDSLLSFRVFVGQSRRTSFASYRAVSNYFNSESWSGSTSLNFQNFLSRIFLTLFVTKILKVLNRAVIVLKWSGCLDSNAWAADFTFLTRGATWMTRSEFSKWSGNRVVCISFAPGEEESFGNSRRAPVSRFRSEVFSITRKLWVPNGRFSTSGRRKRRVKPNFCRIEDSGRSVICFRRSYWKRREYT